MIKLLFLFALTLMAGSAAHAAGGSDHPLDKVRIDLADKAALQSGARIFVTQCLLCHSAAYMRYNRMGEDLGLTDELVKDQLLYAAEKPGDPMRAVMAPEAAKASFGVAPPDLTLIARSRGPDWFYTYMRSFYLDDKNRSGWNNPLLPNVAMPHVLSGWQGSQRAVLDKNGKIERLEIAEPGSMSAEEYNAKMRDLTHFMVYLGEPAKLVRYQLGGYVLAFAAIFLVFAYLLKREYWRDIH